MLGNGWLALYYSGQVTDAPKGTFTQMSANGHTCAVEMNERFSVGAQKIVMKNLIRQVVVSYKFHLLGLMIGGLDINNNIQCWGYSSYDTIYPPDGDFIHISSGGFTACGIDIDRQVQCWGYTQYLPPTNEFVQISAGSSFVCGADIDRNIQCWGIHSGGAMNPPTNFKVWNGGQ